MQNYRCENCGSTELVVKNGYKVCPYCETRYAAISTTTISLKSDIEMLLEKCKNEPRNARRYANRVLDIDPDNKEALRYL